MATRSITIKDSAYEILASRKKEGESFSDVIERMGKRRSLLELVDAVSRDEAEEIAKEVEKVREETGKEIEERTDKIQEALE